MPKWHPVSFLDKILSFIFPTLSHSHLYPQLMVSLTLIIAFAYHSRHYHLDLDLSRTLSSSGHPLKTLLWRCTLPNSSGPPETWPHHFIFPISLLRTWNETCVPSGFPLHHSPLHCILVTFILFSQAVSHAISQQSLEVAICQFLDEGTEVLWHQIACPRLLATKR